MSVTSTYDVLRTLLSVVACRFMPDTHNLNTVMSKHQINPNEDHSLKKSEEIRKKNLACAHKKCPCQEGQTKAEELFQIKGD